MCQSYSLSKSSLIIIFGLGKLDLFQISLVSTSIFLKSSSNIININTTKLYLNIVRTRVALFIILTKKPEYKVLNVNFGNHD